MSSKNFRDCKAVLFDFGGTLDSDGGHWLDRFYELYDQACLRVAKEEIKNIMETTVDLEVPLFVDVETGSSWNVDKGA